MKCSNILYATVGIIVVGITVLGWSKAAEALSVRHHLINAGTDLVKMVVAPVKGIFATGPNNIKTAYRYEAYETESPKERSGFFGIWRAPGEELKGVIDGVTEMVTYGGKVLWELISIPWSD